MLNKQLTIEKTKRYVKNRMEGEGTGHDWHHVERVLRTAKHIAKKEGKVDMFIVELATLLHDIADWKFHKGDDTVGPKLAKAWLEKQGVDKKDIVHVCDIIQRISFKGGTNKARMETKEGMIAQDADRLDALGAIGIARAFAYGGSLGRELYNPRIKPKKYRSFSHFKSTLNKSTTINHFYEKLLLLKGSMNTKTAKRTAVKREEFMRQFLNRFYSEWKGEV